MKNELMNSNGNQVLNVVKNSARWLAKQGLRTVQLIPDAVGNIMKITTYKNHNIDIHFFMKK